MKTVLITGGSGFIGSHLAKILIERGLRVKIFDRSVRRENIKDIQNHIEIVEGDIRDYDKIEKTIKGCDVVFHLAALISISQSLENPQKTNDVNVNGTLNALLASRKNKIKRFIFTSSSAVYGDCRKLPIKEECPKNPTSPYAVSKLAAEEYCKTFSKIHNLPVTILRYFNVFGPHQNLNYAGVITQFINALSRGDTPLIYGDGEQTRDFIYIHDAVDAAIRAMNSKHPLLIVNIGTGKQTSVNGLFTALCTILNKPPTATYKNPRDGDIRHSVADITKAKITLDFKPSYTLTEGLKETIQYFE